MGVGTTAVVDAADDEGTDDEGIDDDEEADDEGIDDEEADDEGTDDEGADNEGTDDTGAVLAAGAMELVTGTDDALLVMALLLATMAGALGVGCPVVVVSVKHLQGYVE